MPNKLNKILLFLLSLAIITMSAIFILAEYYGEPIFKVEEATSNLDGKLEVYFFDVGQGDSAFLKTPYGQKILIDGGPNNDVVGELDRHISFFDRRIDLIIITHPHSDHITGLIEVIKRYSVGKILYTGVSHNSPAYLKLLETIKNHGTQLEIVDTPQKIVFGSDCYIDIIHPFASLKDSEVDNLNNTSIVARLTYKANRVLFTGDIEKEVEEKLTDNHLAKCVPETDYSTSTVSYCLNSQVLKSPHHGSATSNTEEFIAAINPQTVVISVGADNRFGHPHLQVVNRYSRSEIEIKRMDQSGTIYFDMY